MQETTVMCDVCGVEMEVPTEMELSGILIKHGDTILPEINLEDICTPCSCALESAISDVILRRSPK